MEMLVSVSAHESDRIFKFYSMSDGNKEHLGMLDYFCQPNQHRQGAFIL